MKRMIDLLVNDEFGWIHLEKRDMYQLVPALVLLWFLRLMGSMSIHRQWFVRRIIPVENDVLMTVEVDVVHRVIPIEDVVVSLKQLVELNDDDERRKRMVVVVVMETKAKKFDEVFAMRNNVDCYDKIVMMMTMNLSVEEDLNDVCR